MKNSENVITY